jgi:transcriptional regulator with XRE-family HTH domain
MLRGRGKGDLKQVTLQQLRIRLGLSQERLGSELGTSQPAVNKIESAADPRLSSVRRFVEAIGRATNQDAVAEVTATIGKERFMIGFPMTKLTLPNSATRRPPATRGEPKAWRLRAWDDPGIEQAILDRSIVAISADELGDLSDHYTREDLRALLRASPVLADRGDQAIGMFATYWDIFRNRINPSDLVVVPLGGRRFALGEITGDYEYLGGEPDRRLRHVRDVQWLMRSCPRDRLPSDIRAVVNAPGTICALNQRDVIARLRDVLE